MAYGDGVIFDTISKQEAPAAPLKMKKKPKGASGYDPMRDFGTPMDKQIRAAYERAQAAYQKTYGEGSMHHTALDDRLNPGTLAEFGRKFLGGGAAGGAPGAGGPGGAEGSGGLTLDKLYGDYQSAFDEAQAANKTRYADILKGYGARYDRNMKYLEGAGIQEGADIRDQYREAGNTQRNRLASQGLAGTTIAPTMQMGIERQQRAELGRLNERLQNQRLSTDASLSGDALAFQERRDDVGPDYGFLATLAQGIGAAGNNMSGGGSTVTSSGGGGSYHLGVLPDRGTHMANRGMAAAPQTQPYPGMPATAGGAGMVAQRPAVRPRMSYYGA